MTVKADLKLNPIANRNENIPTKYKGIQKGNEIGHIYYSYEGLHLSDSF